MLEKIYPLLYLKMKFLLKKKKVIYSEEEQSGTTVSQDKIYSLRTFH